MDIVEFIEKRRRSFKNPCLFFEPIKDWIFWASGHGALYFSRNKGEFDSIGICWRIHSADHSKSTFSNFVDYFDPFINAGYDLFVLDFFSDNSEARKNLITSMVSSNKNMLNVWAIRNGKTVKISKDYILKFYKI